MEADSTVKKRYTSAFGQGCEQSRS